MTIGKGKRPRDTNQLAKFIVDVTTGQVDISDPDAGKNPAAVSLGRLGGAKGGKARADKLSPAKRKQIAAPFHAAHERSQQEDRQSPSRGRASAPMR